MSVQYISCLQRTATRVQSLWSAAQTVNMHGHTVRVTIEHLQRLYSDALV